MKLRNKKTGVITEYVTNFYIETTAYHSLAELNEEWEDYEPKTNSRFRLVKDLPTFKAGQEFYLSPKGNLILNDGKFGICAYARQTLEKFPNILEEWFEPIDDEDVSALNIELTKDQDAINWLRSENAYLEGRVKAYEEFLKDKGFIKEK